MATIKDTIYHNMVFVDNNYGLWGMRYLQDKKAEIAVNTFIKGSVGSLLPLMVFADQHALDEFVNPTVSFDSPFGDVEPVHIAARNHVRRCRQAGVTPAAATIAEWVEHLGLLPTQEIRGAAEPYSVFSSLTELEVVPEKMDNLTLWLQFIKGLRSSCPTRVEASPVLQFLFVEHLKSLINPGPIVGMPLPSFGQWRRRWFSESRSIPLDVQLAMPGGPQ